MNINELTLGQIKELQTLLSEQPTKVGELENFGTCIVVLQRGWVVLGKLIKKGDYFELTNGYCVRRWGTKDGLGELAEKGKLAETQLEKMPLTRFHELTVIQIISCNEEKWNEKTK